MTTKEWNKEEHEAMLAAFWNGRPALTRQGFISFAASYLYSLPAVAIARIDWLRAKGRQDYLAVKTRELRVKTALQLIDHPIFQWSVRNAYSTIKVYKKRTNVASKTASLIAHDRVLLETGPSLPSHYGTTLTVNTACLNSAIITTII